MSWVSTAIAASNQIQQGKYAKAQAGLTAMQDEYQAGIEQKQALDLAKIIRNAGARQVGQANGAYAAAGVKVGEGSALETERFIEQGTEHDAYQAILEGSRRARGLQTDAQMALIEGRLREKQGYVNAANTALGRGYSNMKAGGWRSQGPGFAGTQRGAPIEDRSSYGSPASRKGYGWEDS